MSCARCSKSHSTVQAFLLTCNDCGRKWHHRCHIPPVSDQELILRIKAHNSGDPENGLQAWKCKRCARGGTASVGGTPGPQVPAAPPQTQATSRPPPSRNLLPSESHRPTPVPQNISRIPNSSDFPPNVGRVNTFQSQSSGRERTKSSTQPSQQLPSTTQSERRVAPSIHKDDDIIVIDDSDSDSSRHASSKPVQSMNLASTRTSAPASTKRFATDKKSTTHISTTAHPLAQEEEESSDSSNRPPVLARLPSQSYDQPPKFTTSHQGPIRAGAEGPGSDITLPTPPLDRKELVSEDADVQPAQKIAISRQPLSQPEKDIMRDQFIRNAAEKERRRRREHRLRQQQILQAKVEEKESVEEITSDVVDLDLNNNQHMHVTPTEQPLPSTSTNEKGSLPVETTATIASTSAKVVGESSLAPHWINARVDNDDTWVRALKKKGLTAPPSATRRKIVAQKLGEVRPQVYQFDARQWVDALKRGRY